MLTQNEERLKIQKEAFAELKLLKRRTADISPRVGKTLIGINVIAEKWTEIRAQDQRDPKILIVAPKLTIFDSWKEDFDKFAFSYLRPNVDYSTYVSLNKIDLSQYDLIIFDEAHSMRSNHSYNLSRYKGDILGLTGTAPKNKYQENYRMIDKYCPIVYTYKTEEAIDANILNDYRIIVHMIPLSVKNDIHVKRGTWDFMTSETKSYIYSSKKVDEALYTKDKQWAAITRMKQLQTYKSKEEYTKKLLDSIEDKCIVFANTKDQADMMSEYSHYSGNKNNKVNLEMFKAGIVDKLACVNQLTEGITIPDLKASIIMHTFSEASPKTLQKFARALSLSTEEMSNVHFLVYKNTIEEQNIKAVLKELDQSKIKYVEFDL